ncbi:MAG: hypothetical protein H6Q74_945 [Firmicutes bacterium]|nr:hypothetical protein [Bacillota bacterium]
MSAFIGQIHYWLYGKIQLVSQREEYIYGKAYEMCGATAEELREQVMQTYGEPLPDVDLSEIIDHDNIHGWLQRQINIVETREAAFIKELLDTCGGVAKEMLEQAFLEHGKMTGDNAKIRGKYDMNIAPGIYKALNDYYLNGMPCDQADMVVTSQPDSVVWETGTCLQEPNWKRVGGDIGTMIKLYRSWLKGFVGGINADYCFRQVPDRLDGASVNRYEIYRV